jgi:hypothetical protein
MATPGQSSLFSAFSELVTTTYRSHKKEVADHVTKHNALYRKLIASGQKRLEDGGLSIVCPLEYQENSTYQRYSGYDALAINPVDVVTAAEFPWKQIAIHLAASGLELRQNSGKNRIINLAKTKLKNAIKSFANGFSADLYSDGSATNQINGLQALIADAGTGTVGGINSTTWTFWKNKVQSAASPLQGGAGITPGSTTMESLMLPLWIALTRGADTPNLIVMDDTYFAFYEQSQTPYRRYASDDKEGQGGFTGMRYKTAEVFFDSGGGIPSAHAYFINTDYLELVVHKDADQEILDDVRGYGQDAIVTPIIWMGNLVTNGRQFQGVMKA